MFYDIKTWYFIWNVCQQTIHMQYQVLFEFLKKGQILERSSAIISGTVSVGGNFSFLLLPDPQNNYMQENIVSVNSTI